MQARQHRSRALIERIRKWRYAQKALPKSALERAIKSVDGSWDGLLVSLEDPVVPIQNNGAERGMRSVALSRKNHYRS